MKLTFALLLMATTLGAGSAVFAAGQGLPLTPDPSLAPRTAPSAALTLIDDDGDEGEGGWFWSLSHDDDDNGDDDDDCEDEHDGGNNCASGAASNAAKAGTAPPPNNGLFTDGTAPVVTSN